jgi:hypothetical protein
MPTIMDDISEPRGEHLGEIRAQQRPKHAREPHRVSARKARTSSGDQPGKQNNVVPGVGVVPVVWLENLCIPPIIQPQIRPRRC